MVRFCFNLPRIVMAGIFIAGFLNSVGDSWSVDAPQTYWQLTLAYDSNSVRILKAAEIAPLRKRVQTPGLNGAPVKIVYQADWLSGGAEKVLASTRTEIPLGARVPMETGGACETIIPSEGIVVIRLAGPGPNTLPQSLRLTRAGETRVARVKSTLPSPFLQSTQVIPIAGVVRVGEVPGPPGPIGSVKIRSTGPDSNRLVFVICGDGYISDDLNSGQYSTNVNNLLGAFLAKSPWNTCFASTNVYRVDVVSNERGADRSKTSSSPMVDTYFNSTFWYYGIERLLALDSVGMNRAISAADSQVGAGVWDYIFIVVNSTKYGGSGGQMPVTSIHSSAPEIVLHEFGHTIANLADEYSDPYPGYPEGDSEPNVDYDFDLPHLKWAAWVTQGAPLPTPNDYSYSGVVGAFEGARYKPTGIYRPCYTCAMKALGVAFCPICEEAQILAFFKDVNLIDSTYPPVGTFSLSPAGCRFSATPLPIKGLTFKWYLNNNALPGATSSSLQLGPGDFSGMTAALKLQVAYPTNKVRLSTITENYAWQINVLSPTPTPGPSPTPTVAPRPTLTPMPDLLVTNVSRSEYIVVPNELQANDLVYTDQSYLFTDPIPSYMYKKTYIMTVQGDKDTTSPASFLSFDINRDAVVYVAIDKKITTPPTWLSSWAVLSDSLLVNDSGRPARRIYSRKFVKGHVTLGPNRNSTMPKGNSMYTVVISPIVTGVKEWPLYSQKGPGKESLIVTMGRE